MRLDSKFPAPAAAESVLHAVQSVCGAPAALHEPVFEGRERDYVKDCLDTGWVSTAGAYVEKFESMLCEITAAVPPETRRLTFRYERPLLREKLAAAVRQFMSRWWIAG